MYPMKLLPAYKDYLWGGTRLITQYGKTTTMTPLAESWEVSCHPDGPTYIANGEYAGKSLRDVLAATPDMTGERCADKPHLPVLMKLIDAEQKLSLQVHPDNEYAARNENQPGKNEMWYVADANPGAEIILGLNQELTKPQLHTAIENGTILDYVRRIPVKPGDCYCVPAGMLHAIGAGVVIAEVQQSSNVTYRVYDYGRKGPDGNPRELHIDKAVDVTDTSLTAVKSEYGTTATPEYDVERLSDWEYFDARRYALHGVLEMSADSQSFHTWVCLSGSLNITHYGVSYSLTKGESVFIPAGMGVYTLSGDAVLLYCSM